MTIQVNESSAYAFPGSATVFSAINRIKGSVSWYFSVEEDTKTTNVFLKKLGELEKFRPGTGTLNITATQSEEIQNLFRESDEFLEKTKVRTCFCLRAQDKKNYQRFLSKQASMKLHLQSLKDVFTPTEGLPLDASSKSQLEKNCQTWFKELLRPTLRPDLDENELYNVETIIDGLPRNNRDRTQLEQTVDRYRKVRAEVELALGPQGSTLKKDLSEIALRAQACADKIFRDFSDYAPLLLEDKVVQTLFQKQVIIAKLPLDVFFHFPQEASFLKKAESLSKSLTNTPQSIEVGASGFPEILFEGRKRAIRTLPGYEDGSFKNLMGWWTLGLNPKGKNWPMVSPKCRENCENAYSFSPEKGLIPWNPRTWETRLPNGEWQGVDLHTEKWWEQLPIYETATLDLEDENDEGWRIRHVTTHTEDGAQLKGTHSFLIMSVPLEDQKGTPEGKVKVARYPFGKFAYPFEFNQPLKRFATELHYFDSNVTMPERGVSSFEDRLTKENAYRAMEVIRQERLNAIAESKGEADPTFQVLAESCTVFVVRVAAAAGVTLPSQHTFKGLTRNRLYRLCMSTALNTPFLLKIMMGFMGASGDDIFWNGITYTPLTLRKFLQLKEETKRLEHLLDAGGASPLDTEVVPEGQ